MLNLKNTQKNKNKRKNSIEIVIFSHIVKAKGYCEIYEINAMASFYNSIHHSISIHSLFFDVNETAYNFP